MHFILALQTSHSFDKIWNRGLIQELVRFQILENLVPLPYCLNLLAKGAVPMAKFPDLASTFPIHYDLAQHNISELVKLLAWH